MLSLHRQLVLLVQCLYQVQKTDNFKPISTHVRFELYSNFKMKTTEINNEHFAILVTALACSKCQVWWCLGIGWLETWCSKYKFMNVIKSGVHCFFLTSLTSLIQHVSNLRQSVCFDISLRAKSASKQGFWPPSWVPALDVYQGLIIYDLQHVDWGVSTYNWHIKLVCALSCNKK